MNIKNIVIAAIVVAAVGLIIAVLLSVAEKLFHIDIDEKEMLIREQLAGNNCGACGYAGCDALAKAISVGEAKADSCPVSGENAVKKIAEIMGVEALEFIKKTAFVKCSGTCEKRHLNYNYVSEKDCRLASLLPGGDEKSCNFGCMGYGSCLKVCENNAIKIINGIANINPELCVACGKCVKACPKKIIEIIPFAQKYAVACSNNERGKAVKDNCKAGCIGCGLCSKNCPNEAITLHKNLAFIDYGKCTTCGICYEKCPVKIIKSL